LPVVVSVLPAGRRSNTAEDAVTLLARADEVIECNNAAFVNHYCL
jgi:hypothetical protein